MSFAETYFAEVDETNKVIRVIVAEPDFIATMPGTWIQTADDSSTGRARAERDDTFDKTRGGFIRKKLNPSWVLDEQTLKWKPPKEKPKDGKDYYWNEDAQEWMKIKNK